jgi:hypothetical protein
MHYRLAESLPTLRVVSFLEGAARPLVAGEQALYDAVEEAARGALETGAATLAGRWRHWQGEASCPEFELRPQRRDALPVTLSWFGGAGYVEATFYLDDMEPTFELMGRDRTGP